MLPVFFILYSAECDHISQTVILYRSHVTNWKIKVLSPTSNPNCYISGSTAGVKQHIHLERYVKHLYIYDELICD